tara:strand:+ start:8196 stop:8414 length:219 start_codon:yes stop_codon:yes gene_type:complete
MTSSSNRTDRGQNSENYIAAAKRAAKAALRKRNPKLTALERGFYIKYKAELDAARSTLIQTKKPRRNHKQAA